MTESNSLRFPIFIVGMPRSGTTLLSSVLDAHSQITITPETHFYTRCHSGKTAVDTRGDVWDRLQQQPGVQDMGVTEEEIERIWDHLDRSSELSKPADLLGALCSTYAERSGAEAWGEKTPDHLAHVPTLLEEFPEAVVLCIVRDPRDVCLSLRDMPWNRSSLLEMAWKWRRYAGLAARYEQAYPNRFRTVTYEDLVSNPEPVLREVLGWLEAPYQEEVLAFHNRDTGPADLEREPWKENIQEPIDSSNKGKWRTQMGPGERWIVQTVTGERLRDWGYSAPTVPFDVTFVRDLVQVLWQSFKTIAGRMVRRWQTPPREADDHRPTWMRRRQFLEEE
jgi:hypothetical protein